MEGEVSFSFAPPSLPPILFFLVATSHPRPTCQSDLLISTGFIPRKFSIEFLSLVLRQLHFPDLTHGGLFDRTKLSQAHIVELGCVLQGLSRPFPNFPQHASSYSPQIHGKPAPERDSLRSRLDPWRAGIWRRTFPRSSLSSVKTWSRYPRLPLAPSLPPQPSQ